MKHAWRTVGFLLLIVLLLGLSPFAANAAGTLTLPRKLRAVEAQAFYGDKTLGKVVLPSGIKTIGSKAFANSSMYEINLPDSLTSIADDAFDAPSKVTVVVSSKNSYAYNWAVKNKYLYTPAKPTISAATASGNSITVSWGKVAGATEYTVFYGTSTAIKSAKSVSAGTSLSKKITGLDYSKTYYIWVKAGNIYATGSESTRKSVKTGALPAVTISTQPSAKTVGVGGSVTFSVKASGGNGSYTYQWYKASGSTVSGSKISGATGASYTFTAAAGDDGKYYYCKVTSGTNSANSSRAKLTVTQALSITTQPSAKTASVGGSVTFTVKASGGAGSYAYQWYKASSATAGGSKISGATGASYTFKAAAGDDGKYYYCKVTSGGESLNSSRAKLTVSTAVDPEFLSTPQVTGGTYEGDTYTVTCSTTSSVSYVAVCYKDGSNVTHVKDTFPASGYASGTASLSWRFTYAFQYTGNNDTRTVLLRCYDADGNYDEIESKSFTCKRNSAKPTIAISSVSPASVTNNASQYFVIHFTATNASSFTVTFNGLKAMEKWSYEMDYISSGKTSWTFDGENDISSAYGWTYESTDASLYFYPEAGTAAKTYSFTLTAAGDGGTSDPVTGSVTVSDKPVLPSSLYLTQQSSTTCTLASAAMMLRGRAYLSNYSSWSAITEAAIKSTAWKTGDGLYFNFTYSFSGNSITVAHVNQSGMSAAALKSLLNAHPEGIVLYCYDSTNKHAVFVTDYEGDTFYCGDPYSKYSGSRRPLADTLLGSRYGNQAGILNMVKAYWYVSSYSIK